MVVEDAHRDSFKFHEELPRICADDVDEIGRQSFAPSSLRTRPHRRVMVPKGYSITLYDRAEPVVCTRAAGTIALRINLPDQLVRRRYG